jgi:hypothetical protein
MALPVFFSYALDLNFFFFRSLINQFNNSLFLLINPIILNSVLFLLKYGTFNQPAIFLELSAFDNLFISIVPSSVLIYTFFLLFLKLKIFLFIKIADNYGLISGSSVFFNLN